MVFRFAARHLARHWRINLAVLAVMVLCSSLLAGLPMYAAMIAGQSLTLSLASAFAPVRNLEIATDNLDDEQRARLDAVLGNLVDRQVEIRAAVVDVERTIYQPQHDISRRIHEVLFLRLWSFPLEDDVRLVSGRFPRAEPIVVDSHSVVEAVVGARAAEHMSLELGDEVAMENEPQHRVRIVGIVTPIDPESEIWWGDPTLLPFNVERIGTADVDSLYLSLIVCPETMSNEVPNHDASWRFLLHWDQISADGALVLRDGLVGLANVLSAQDARLRTGLVDLIDHYQSQRALGQVALLLLTAQSLLAALYIQSSLSAFLVDRSRTQLTSMIGRGYSVWQITRLYALEALWLGLIALLVGPSLAYAGFRVLSHFSNTIVLERIPGESWVLSLVAVVFSWGALVIALHLVARKLFANSQEQQSRPRRRPKLQRLVLDAFLLILGALAYWQLRDTGSFVRQVEGPAGVGVDPVLLLGPSLLLLALGLVFLRLFPVMLSGLAWLGQRSRSLVLPLSIARLARNPRGPNRIILLISLAVGLVFFATVFGYSVSQRQITVARYLTGADVRVALALDRKRAQADTERIHRLEGVAASTSVYRGQARWSAFESTSVNYRALEIAAVDPSSFADVSSYPSGIGTRSMDGVMELLSTSDTQGAIPSVLSSNAPPGVQEVGDRVQYRIGGQTCEFVVQGIIDDFPTLSPPFIVTRLDMLEEQIELDNIFQSQAGWRELWLKTDPARHTSLVSNIKAIDVDLFDAAMFQSGRIAGDVETQLSAFRSDLVAQITVASFGLNAAVLVFVSSISFVALQVFAAQSRAVEFGVLRAMGLSTEQLLGILALEGFVMLGLGLVAGTGIGYGLAYIMRPFLSLSLASSLGGKTIDRVLINWDVLGPIYAALIGIYLLSIVFLLVALLRSKIHRVMRIGEE